MEANKLIFKAANYVLINDVLYKRGYSLPYLRYLDPIDDKYVLEKIYKGIHDNHMVDRFFAHKVIRQGYYWLNLTKEIKKYTKQ